MHKNRYSYDDDFRREAINLVITSGRPVSQIARELGVAPQTLHTWIKRFLPDTRLTSGAGGDQSEAGIGDPMAEIRKLRREVDYLKRQREILKKAMSIIGESPRSGMP